MWPCGDASAQLFIQDSLVKRVLVDHHHPVAGLGDQITVMNLNGLEHAAKPERELAAPPRAP